MLFSGVMFSNSAGCVQSRGRAKIAGVRVAQEQAAAETALNA